LGGEEGGAVRNRTGTLTSSRRFSFGGKKTLREKVLKLRDKTQSERSFALEKEFKEVEGVVEEMGSVKG
jgi:hypothetical protein